MVFGDSDTGVTFFPGLGGFVTFGLAGRLVNLVVLAGGVGAVHAGVITGLITLSVVLCVVFLLVGPFFVTGATVVTVFISSLVVSGGGVARVLGRNCVVRLVGSGRFGV